MTGHIYLIRNKELYKIGITKDIKNRMKTLKPDEIVKVLKIDSYKEIEKRLHKRYKYSRIPQTEYFRLSKSQLVNCKKALTFSYTRRARSIPSLIAIITIVITPITCFIWSIRQRCLQLGLIAFAYTLLSIYIYPSFDFTQTDMLIFRLVFGITAFIIAKRNKGEALT